MIGDVFTRELERIAKKQNKSQDLSANELKFRLLTKYTPYDVMYVYEKISGLP